jgi:hypothetical protein
LAQRRIQELLKAKLQAEQSHEAAQQDIANLKGSLQKQTEGFDELRKQKEAQIQALDEEKDEKERWFEEKLTLLATRKHEAEAPESGSNLPGVGSGADPSLLEAIESLGKTTEKARREMSNLVAGKNRPEQVFTKWENVYCKPSLDVVLLAKQIKADRAKHNREYTEQIADLVRREETVKLLEDFEASNRLRKSTKLQEDIRNLAEEKRTWRLAQAQKLGAWS